MIHSNEHDRLIYLLKTYSLKTGEEFELASGEKSTTYIDVKKTVMRGRATNFIARMLHDQAFKFEVYEATAGVALGGCHLASIVAAYASFNRFSDKNILFIRKETKKHGTKNLLEMPEMAAGSNVVLFEDVITTGNSALAAAKILTKAKLRVKGIVAVVDRRAEKVPVLGNYPLASLVRFDELL